MLCDKCKKNQANIHVSRIINGVKYEQNLCMECAGVNPQEMFGMFPGFESMFGDMQQAIMVGAPQHQAQAGLGDTDFEALGLKLPGSGFSSPALPKEKEETLEELKQQLAAAVSDEKFELAAELRDRIYVMEKKLMGEL